MGEQEALDVVYGRLARFDNDSSWAEKPFATHEAVEVPDEVDERAFLQEEGLLRSSMTNMAKKRSAIALPGQGASRPTRDKSGAAERRRGSCLESLRAVLEHLLSQCQSKHFLEWNECPCDFKFFFCARATWFSELAHLWQAQTKRGERGQTKNEVACPSLMRCAFAVCGHTRDCLHIKFHIATI